MSLLSSNLSTLPKQVTYALFSTSSTCVRKTGACSKLSERQPHICNATRSRSPSRSKVWRERTGRYSRPAKLLELLECCLLTRAIVPVSAQGRVSSSTNLVPPHRLTCAESPSSPIHPPRRFTHQYSADCCSDHEHSSQSHSSDKTVPFTPEEEAENFRRALGFGHQAELVNAAVKTQLPAQLGQAVEAAVDAAVTSQFRPVLQAILPKAVEALFVPSPPGSPILSFDSDGNCYPALPPLSPLGEMLLPHLRSHLTAQIYLQQQQTLQRFEKLARKTFAKLEESAFEDRARAHVEFEDEIEELKSEVLLLKKDAVDEVWREGQELVDKGKEACARFGEDIDHHLGRTLNKIDATVGGNGLRKLVAREMRRQHKGRKKAVPKRRTV